MRKTIYYLITALALTVCGACSNGATENNIPASSSNVEIIDVTPAVTDEVKPTEGVTVVTVTPEVDVTPEPTPVVEVTPVPTSTPVPTVAPTATPIPVTQLDVEGLKSEFKDYGTFIGGAGMSVADYEKAMNRKWNSLYADNNDTFSVDIKKEYKYEDLQTIMLSWTNYNGVSVYDIGTSVQGRTLYGIDIDRTTVENPKTIVLTGNTHARETAGSVFIIKQLNDLLSDENADEYLSKVRILAVPCVNPDGRDGVAFDTDNFTYNDGLLWKANANGVDLNRNFPGLSWGQLKSGNNQIYLYSDTPKKMYFPGYSGGSEPETKALMKFLQYAIVDEQADILIDYHQQGRIQYAGKPWQNEEEQARCKELASVVSKFMANDKTYLWQKEDASYGLRGEGSTLTDYACSLACGAKFSEKYGFLVYTDGENEYPLITGKRVGETANKHFATTTIEIGSGTAYLGYSDATRENHKAEYEKYNFGELLYEIFDYLLRSEDTTEEFKVLDQKEFPTGCESVSATMVLNYYGYNITAGEFIDNYLDTIATPEEFYEGGKNEDKLVYDYFFVGDPRKEVGKACNAPVIINALNKYFDDINHHSKTPVNLTGLSFEEVSHYCNDGTPVLLWVSGELKGSTKYTDFGKFRVWKNRHCCVLLNADKATGVVTVADPMIGAIREWDWQAVEEQFIKYGQQAVCLQ